MYIVTNKSPTNILYKYFIPGLSRELRLQSNVNPKKINSVT